MLFESLVTGGAALLGGGINAATGYANNERNIAMQRETNQMNERLMRENWGREDNAVTRRVNDLKNAGLSPVLAAGSAAQSSAPIKMDSPNSEDWGPSATGGAMQAILGATQVARTNMDLKKTAAEINNIEANTEGTYQGIFSSDQNMDIQATMVDFQTGAIDAATARDRIQTARNAYELKRDKAMGLGEKSTPLSRQAQDVANMVGTGAAQQASYDKKNKKAAEIKGKSSMDRLKKGKSFYDEMRDSVKFGY